jgi:integrase
MGRRDYAILLLPSRLGLRGSEVATLTLDDIDWRAGKMLVRAKGRQRTLMPIPRDVGAAIVAYLCNGRPKKKRQSMRRPQRRHNDAPHQICSA